MKRMFVLALIAILVIGISYSCDFSVKFTKGIGSSSEAFIGDKIEINSPPSYADKFNVTSPNLKSNIVGADIDSEPSIEFDSYGSTSIAVTVYNSSNTSQKESCTFEVNVVHCKGDIKLSIKNDSSTNPPTIALWPTLHVYGFKCNDQESFLITTNISLFSFISQFLQKNGPFDYPILFSKSGVVHITVNETDDNKYVEENYNVSDCKPSVSNDKTCPGEKYTLNLDFPSYCNSSKVKIGVVNDSDDYVWKWINESNPLSFDVYAPGSPSSDGNFYTNIKAYWESSGFVHSPWNETYQINMNPYVGVINATNESVNVALFDCFDQNELPVPCDFSYLIKTYLSVNNLNQNSNFTVSMNVTFPNGYTDRYAKKVEVTGGNFEWTFFGFDGKTNDTCTYTIGNDINCVKSDNKWECNSTNLNDEVYSGSDRLCSTRPYTFTAPCPAPTIQKRWKEVKTIALPIHFTFGIFSDVEDYFFSNSLGEGSTFHRLTQGELKTKTGNEVNVSMRAYRYRYTWSISPLNWLVQVFSRKDFVPIRIGFNQTTPQTLNGVGKLSTMCTGKSLCYTEVPMCGDGVCDTASGESCKTCPQDCACGAGTKGCYGTYIKGFTDQRGCIIRYKKYEEPCYTDAECGSEYGTKLYCVHTYAGNSFHVVGHCCAKDEIWDPNTPPGFQDANSSIKGTCRVPRGVWIESINIKDIGNCPWSNCDFQASVCNGGYTESIPDTEIVVKVHTEYPHDKVCAGFGTEPDKCCKGAGISWWGGATQYCIDNPNSNDVTFTFRMNDRAPHVGLGSGVERRCNSDQPMIFFVYLPYELTSEYQQHSGINVTTYGNASLQYGTDESFEYLLNQWRKNKLYYSNSHDNDYPYSCSIGYSHIETSSSGGGDLYRTKIWFYPFGGCTDAPDWREVNNHLGNILKDKYDNERWAEIVYVYNSGSNSCKNKKTAGWDVGKVKVVFPKGASPPSVKGRFVCGGNKIRPWDKW